MDRDETVCRRREGSVADVEVAVVAAPMVVAVVVCDATEVFDRD